MAALDRVRPCDQRVPPPSDLPQADTNPVPCHMQMENYQAWAVPTYLGPPIGKSHNIVLVKDMSNRSFTGNLLTLHQVVNILCERVAISQASLRKKIRDLPKQKLMTVTNLALITQLRGLGIIKSKASRVTLVSVHTITSALKGFKQMQAVMINLNQLKTALKDTAGPAINMATLLQQPPATLEPTPVLMPATQPSAPQSQLQVILPAAVVFYPYTTSFPDKLPQVNPSSSQLTQKYGLLHRYGNVLLNCMPIKDQLPAYKDWCKDKMDFSRPVQGISSTTFSDHFSTISLFLGYCQLYQHAPLEAMSLKLFSNHMLVLNWLAFGKARSCSSQHMTSTISHINRVLEWLKAKDPEAKADPRKVSIATLCNTLMGTTWEGA